jgi:glycosyltransferase involved in cell wall biosynthesis
VDSGGSIRILHVNDVASVGSLLVQASSGRDELYQPALRRQLRDHPLALAQLAFKRGGDVIRIRKRFRGGNFSHLHVHYGYFATFAPGLPFSLHLHGADLLMDLSNRVKGPLTRSAIARASRVIVSTPNLLKPAQRLRNDTIYLPNPIEVPRRSIGKNERPAPHVTVLSRMDPLKGWPRQIEILRALQDRIPLLTFSFCAEGQLDAAAREGMARAMVHMGGTPVPWLPRDAFVDYVGSGDFALGQLELGALGMSELEAMASGIPTIADGNSHVELGYHPVLIPPIEAAGAVAALWCAGPVALEAFGQRTREYVAQVHSPHSCLLALERTLQPVSLELSQENDPA